MLVGVTGHRPERLGQNWPAVERWIFEKLEGYKRENEKVSLISGMARGVDQIAAKAAIDVGVGLRCYFSYLRGMNDFENYLVDHAEEVRYEYDRYVPQSYKDRDRRIVEDCDVLLVVWDGVKTGGTYYTYKYALSIGKPVVVFNIIVGGTDVNARPI